MTKDAGPARLGLSHRSREDSRFRAPLGPRSCRPHHGDLHLSSYRSLSCRRFSFEHITAPLLVVPRRPYEVGAD